VLIGSFACRVKPDKQSEFCASVADLMDRVRWLRGCVDCLLVADVAMDGSFRLISGWSDRAGLDRFLQSAEYRVLKGMRILMEDEPRLTVDEVVRRSGLSSRLPLVREFRGTPAPPTFRRRSE
jgi:quinol monooxygenase YgiN